MHKEWSSIFSPGINIYILCMYLLLFLYPGGKVRAFSALFANIRGKSAIMIRAPNHAEITRSPRRATIARATRALTGVKTLNSPCYTWHYPSCIIIILFNLKYYLHKEWSDILVQRLIYTYCVWTYCYFSIHCYSYTTVYYIHVYS